MRPLRTALFILAFLTSTRSIGHAAWGPDPYGPHVPVCTAAGNQSNMRAISDAAGGAIVAWVDPRSSAVGDIYAQRINSVGNPVWTLNGVPVLTLSGAQDQLAITTDGAGGVILVWSDLRSLSSRDIYAQRLNSSGTKQWGTNGVLISSASNDQSSPSISPDGAGGAVICWIDKRSTTSSDVYAQRVSAAGSLLWTNSGITTQGVPVTVAPGSQFGRLVGDGVGGAIVAWSDSAAGNYDIKSQRLSASTGLEMWTPGGISITSGNDFEQLYDIVPDGLGGALVVWANYTPHTMVGQRLDASGNMLWPGNVTLTGSIDDQYFGYACVGDGLGGMFSLDVFSAQPTVARISPNGLKVWGNGVSLSGSGLFFPVAKIVADGEGGCILLACDPNGGAKLWRLNGTGASRWSSQGVSLQQTNYTGETALVATTDGHSIAAWSGGSPTVDLFAERMDGEGALGAPEPAISGVDDVPNDQGGRVRIAWNRSDRDVAASPGILDYRVWRSVPTHALAAGAFAASRGTTLDANEAASSGRLLMHAFGAQAYAWELVATQAAARLTNYSLVTDTEFDSIPGSFPRTLFMVEARSGTSVSAAHWFSAPDSGYSVDDLPPAVPGPFAAVYSPGSATLHWGANTEPDLAYYRVYRGATRDFEANAATFVGQTTDTTLTDSATQSLFYRLIAFDIHGNPSEPARVGPTGSVDAPAAPPPSGLALSAPVPNPVRASVGALVRFAVPREGNVALRLHDAQGRQRVVLFDGPLAAGQHQISMTAMGAALTPGIYFLRIETGGEFRTRRVAVTD